MTGNSYCSALIGGISCGTDALAFGTVTPRGKKDILLADSNKLMRLRYNPFQPMWRNEGVAIAKVS